ncbi:MAG: hypothetical protein R8J94_19785 [Acidimicrobiia bacterium]|nr:hypothetical protein [Acidimicrobiia bacterium]
MGITETVSYRIPRFLVGRARTQWKGVMVRNTPEEQAGITLLTIDDFMGDLTKRPVELDLAA